MKTIITIPCFNEEGRLPVEKFQKFMASDRDIYFVFVNDGSQDQTLSLLEKLHADYPYQTRVLNLEKNQGKAEAVRQGIKDSLELNPDIVGFWDADLSTPLRAISDLQKIFEEQPQIKWVFGSRVQLLGRHIKRNMFRHYFGRVFATMASIALNIPVYDTQCGAKLFLCDDVLKAAVKEPFKTTWIFDVELIARLVKATGDSDIPNRIIYEYPLREWVNREGSKVQWLDYAKAVRDLICIWLYMKIR